MTPADWYLLFLFLVPCVVLAALGVAWGLRGRPRLQWFAAVLAVIVVNSIVTWSGYTGVVDSPHVTAP